MTRKPFVSNDSRMKTKKFLTRSDTNWPVQSQKKARSLKLKMKRDCTSENLGFLPCMFDS